MRPSQQIADKFSAAEGSSSSPFNARYLIAGPIWDFVFFYAAPLLALAVAILVYYFSPLPRMRVIPTYFLTWDQLFISVLNQGHLVLVFWRSHLNSKIFKTHPWRFTAVPLIALLLCLTNLWAFVILGVLALLWGEYHFSLQTFGIGRIYEARAGNPTRVGRTQDIWLNHAIYFGPLLAGPNITRLLFPFDQFGIVHAQSFMNFPAWIIAHTNIIRPTVIALAVAYVAYYIWFSYRLHRQGHKFSAPKLVLLVSTAVVATLAWGFLPLGVAIFVMHVYHCAQYFAIVWWAEKKNLASLKEKHLRVSSNTAIKLAALFLLSFPAIYGVFAVVARALPDARGMISVVIVVSLCHLWFDGFIWSTSRKQV